MNLTKLTLHIELKDDGRYLIYADEIGLMLSGTDLKEQLAEVVPVVELLEKLDAAAQPTKI